jgi:catechol 2,3-dioxygenase-like lactoylglutathione lyase family enzyme
VDRDVQLSLLGDRDRPVGRVPRSLVTGDNSELIAAVAPLYLDGSVLDVTYGQGAWWRTFTPEPFTWHDLAVDGVDFTALPHGDRSFDAVCFDPPYVPAGGAPTSERIGRTFRSAFGLSAGRSRAEFDGMIFGGLAECCRVADRWLLVKCMEFVDGDGLRDLPGEVTAACAQLGWRKHDVLVHSDGRTGPGGHNVVTVKRARRAHSYLLVFSRRD